MPRVTVYVPDELKARMDEAGESVNWSSVAQRAFNESIWSHRLREEPNDMNNVVERLRSSKQRFSEIEQVLGHTAGRRWAMEEAEYPQLLRAKEFRGCNDLVVIGAVRRLVDPDEALDNDEFLEAIGLDADEHSRVSEPYAAAFIEGACEVYEEVEDRI